MANPTTNFGWVMPTSSSLVTNLPADFNTFGQAVDTSMSELLGGTTGQVLSKTSNTNMDFTWVTPTDQTPLTTKGDLFTFTTVDARLGVGTNGQVLTADSTAATGLAWAAAAPAYVSWTPTFTNVTTGNGTITGSYVKNGKFVSGYARFTMGSTSAITGNIILALPSSTENGNLQFTVIIGDSGSATYSGFGELVGGNLYVYAMLSNSTYVSGASTSATVPMTWTTNDFVQVSFTYKEA